MLSSHMKPFQSQLHDSYQKNVVVLDHVLDVLVHVLVQDLIQDLDQVLVQDLVQDLDHDQLQDPEKDHNEFVKIINISKWGGCGTNRIHVKTNKSKCLRIIFKSLPKTNTNKNTNETTYRKSRNEHQEHQT